ncbi:MAG: bifunctional sulfate adenylyltransferase/adenylylsulfate kinase [Deltaproteobacteria bacterium]
MTRQKYYAKGNDYAESLLVHFRRVESLREEALGYPALDLNSRQLCDLELLLNRAFYPLAGYNCRDDYEAILSGMRLADGTLWPMPVCLDVSEKLAATLEKGHHLALNDSEGFLLAVLTVEEVFKPDKNKEARAVYGTDDPARHPGVRCLLEHTGAWYVGGTVEGLHLPLHYDFGELRQPPAEIHRRFYQNGWRKVLAHHTDNYMHCKHREMVLQAARDVGANVFLHPIVEPNSLERMDHYTKVRCYQEIGRKFPKNTTMLGLLPLAGRWAGPREALWHAIIRKNYGCSHLLVADDHGDPFAEQEEKERFYPLGAAQQLVKEHQEETGIIMVPLQRMAYVEEKAQYMLESAVEAGMKVLSLGRGEFRRRLENDLEVPEWFTYPEIVKEMQYAFPPRSKQGFTIFFTGLSGSGKSTLAKVLFVKFMEMRGRPVTLLDGDIVRKNLSTELNYTKEHRNLNITRIGFVASEITKNGGIAICAPIAPYEESRQANRELISKCGGYIEAYVSTPLSVCEARDRKGLYAKARAGMVKGVTGVSDPYIPPSNPELVIDTTDASPTEAAQEVLLYLEEQGYIV